MPRQVVPLTDTQIRNLKAADTPISKFDGGGLFLLVQPGGGKWWRFKYTFAGKTKTLSFGTYPEITLKEARERRDEARKLVAHNIDPSADRKERKRAALATVTTFEDVFTEWLDIEASKLAITTVDKIRSSMKNHALPKIGSLPIADIKLDVLLAMLRSIEATGALEMARRVRAWTSRVFRYAVIVGKCERDPAADLQGVLRVPVVKHHAALSANDLPAFLRALDDPLTRIGPLTRLALKLIVMTATRPGELRMTQWQEFNLERAEWRVPADRMKMKQEHVAPLSRQALVVIEKIRLFSGNSKFLFPAQGNSNNTLSENTLGKAARGLGFAVTAHGFRSTFSTFGNR
jgi:integrase